MHRFATLATAGLGLALAGCALPKVALGARVSLGQSAAQETAARTRVRSALWIAMIYAPHAERDVDATDAAPEAPAASDMPCAFEPACAFERAAIEAEQQGVSP